VKTKLTQHQIVYRRHIREGKCRYCGGKRTPSRKDCKKCEKYHVKKNREYRARLRQAKDS
jgi:uncharacterized OB-fold protein